LRNQVGGGMEDVIMIDTIDDWYQKFYVGTTVLTR